MRYRKVGVTAYTSKSFSGSTAAKGCSLINLLPNTMYEWSVLTSCNSIATTYSQSSYFTTINPCGYMGTVTVPTVTPCTATITWSNLAPMDTIHIRIKNAVSGAVRCIYISGINNTGQYLVSQLKADTKYFVDIKGKCNSGSIASWTSKVPFTTAKITSRELEHNPLSLAGYPNPSHDYLNYTFDSEKNENYTLKVCDMSGRELLQEIRVAENGSNGDVINVNHYSPGMYLLIVQKGAQTSHFRFNVN